MTSLWLKIRERSEHFFANFLTSRTSIEKTLNRRSQKIAEHAGTFQNRIEAFDIQLAGVVSLESFGSATRVRMNFDDLPTANNCLVGLLPDTVI